MQIAPTIAINTAPSPHAHGPSFADGLVGKKLIEQNMSAFGYKDLVAYGTRIIGNGRGYGSVTDALDAARELKQWKPGTVTNAVAVISSRDMHHSRFALMELNSPLVFKHHGALVGLDGFRWYPSAVVAAINGIGGVLRNDGKAHWWN